MNRTIEVTDTVYARLESHAKGFDKPSNVIERLLDSFERSDASPSRDRQHSEYQLGRESGDGSHASIKSDIERPFDNSEIQRRISRVLARMSIEQVDLFCGSQYSKKVFGINFPLLVRVPTRADSQARRDAVKNKGVSRWTWKFGFTKGDFDYAICTQWFRWNDDSVKEWLEVNEKTLHQQD